MEETKLGVETSIFPLSEKKRRVATSVNTNNRNGNMKIIRLINTRQIKGISFNKEKHFPFDFSFAMLSRG